MISLSIPSDFNLQKFGVDRIAIGHSLAKHVGYDYGGKVIRVDVAHSEGISEGVLMESDSICGVDDWGNRFLLEQAVNY